MPNLRLLLVTILVLSTASFAKPHVGDWQVVKEEIPRGWQIVVVTQFAFPCIFDRANDEELICDSVRRDRLDSNREEIHMRRDRIREIRVERRDGANMLAGAGGGASLGATLGALLVPGARGSSAYLLGLGGASIGAGHGRDVHMLRGKVIYRWP